MRTFTSNLMTILTIGALGLATSSAFASACGGGGGGFKVNYGGIKLNYGGGSYNHHNNHKVYVKKVYTPAYDHCSHPRYRFCYALPGDNWQTIALREYGSPNFCHKIASYNSLPYGTALAPGQIIQLPSIYDSGRLIASTAPAPAPFNPQGLGIASPGQPNGQQFAPQGMLPGGQQFAPQGQLNVGQPNLDQPNQGQPSAFAPQAGQPGSFAPQGQPAQAQPGSFGPQQGLSPPANMPAANPGSQPAAPAEMAAPVANIRVASAEASLPNVMIGSVLLLDGQLLGNERGNVRLRISGMALPIEVLEWTISSAKIRLPEMDLSEGMRAEIEVVRADGSLASKSAVQLTPAATRLALGN